MKRPKVEKLREAMVAQQKKNMKDSYERGRANGLIEAVQIMCPGETFAPIEKPKRSRKTVKKSKAK
jgi:hypothetical protein